MSAELLARLIEAGTPAALVGEVAMALARAEADVAAAREPTAGALRMRRYRERHAPSPSVTCDDGDAQVTEIVTGPALDKESVPQTPLKEINPTRGVCVASAREADPISVPVAAMLTANRIVVAVWIASLTDARETYLLETSVVRWNEMAIRAGLATAKSLTPERRKRLRARLAEHGPDAFTEAIAAVERSSFCRGESAGGWRADFDFLLQASSFTKLIEGSYDRASRNRAAGRTGSGGREDPIFAARRNLGRDGFAGMDATEGTA